MASDDKPPKIVIIPPCYLIFDKAWFCVTPMSQISHIYKTGEAEDCTEFLTDWTLCMQAKGYYKPADKQRIMSKASIYRGILHVNNILVNKEEPAWLEKDVTIPEKNDNFPKDFPKSMQKFPPTFDNDEKDD